MKRIQLTAALLATGARALFYPDFPGSACSLVDWPQLWRAGLLLSAVVWLRLWIWAVLCSTVCLCTAASGAGAAGGHSTTRAGRRGPRARAAASAVEFRSAGARDSRGEFNAGQPARRFPFGAVKRRQGYGASRRRHGPGPGESAEGDRSAREHACQGSQPHRARTPPPGAWPDRLLAQPERADLRRPGRQRSRRSAQRAIRSRSDSHEFAGQLRITECARRGTFPRNISPVRVERAGRHRATMATLARAGQPPGRATKCRGANGPRR